MGQQIPHTVYLDNTCSGENSIRAAVPGLAHVQEDHFHAMRRVTEELPDDLPEKRKWPGAGGDSSKAFGTAIRVTACRSPTMLLPHPHVHL